MSALASLANMLFVLILCTITSSYSNSLNQLQINAQANKSSTVSTSKKSNKTHISLPHLTLPPNLTPSSPSGSSVINFATYIITQNALTDAPDRYAQFVQQAITWLDNEPWPDQTQCLNGHCCTKVIIYLSQGTHTFTLAGDIPIVLTILANGFNVWVKFNMVVKAPVYARAGEYFLFGCIDDTMCHHSDSQISGTATSSMDVFLYMNKTTKQVTIKPQTPTVTLSNIKFTTSCSDISDLEHLIPGVESWVNKQIQEALTQAINPTFNVPQTFQAYPGVNVTYSITDLEFSAKNWAKASADGYLTAQDATTGKWLVYTDPSSADASLQPPSTWPWEHIIFKNNTYNGKPKKEALWLLNGLRVSSTLLTALIWAADTTGNLSPYYNFTALDATLIFNLSWDKPLLGIPFNGTLSVQMGYGIINGTCYQTSIGPPQHNETVVISFYFTDLVGNGTVELEYDKNNVSLAVQITDFNTTELRPVLIKPKLPLPTDVIESMMQTLINSSIPLINSYLAEHAMVIPKNFSQWIPNPQLTLIHQPGCCNGTHGYMQFYSLCSCYENDPLWKSCQHLNCKTVKSKPAQSRSMLSIDSNKNTLMPLQIWTNVYSGNGSKVSCNLDTTGTLMLMSLLNNTNGKCLIASPLLTSATKYYSLKMSSRNKVEEIRLLCNEDCSICGWPGVDVSDTTLGECYEFTYTSSIMLLEKTSLPCIGGNTHKSGISHNKDAVLLTYYNSIHHDCKNATIVSAQNLGNINGKCEESSNTPNTFNYLNSSIDTVGHVEYTLGVNCTAGCKKCNPLYTNIEYNQCFATKQPKVTQQLIFAYDSSTCGNSENNENKDETVTILITIIILLCCIILGGIVYSQRAKLINQWTRLKPKCKCKLPSIDCSKMNMFCKFIFQVQLQKLKMWLVNSFVKPIYTYNSLSYRMKLHNLLLFIATIFIFIELIAWSYESPWDIFDKTSFEDIGIPADVLDVENLETVLSDWQKAAEWYFGMFGLFIILILIFRFICIRKCFGFKWYETRAFILGIYVFLVFMGIYLAVPTLYVFSDAVKLNPNNQNAFTGSSDVENTVNDMIGFSFTGVFLSYFSNILLFWMHSIPFGVYISSVFYLYFLFDADQIVNDNDVQQLIPHEEIDEFENNDEKDDAEDMKPNNTGSKFRCCCCWIEFESKDKNLQHDSKCDNYRAGINFILKSIFQYKADDDLKATMISRIVVIVFLLQSMASCIEALPVIIMYQSFSSNVLWISAWLVWWIIPIFLLYWLYLICNKYIKQLRSQQEQEIQNRDHNDTIFISQFCKKRLIFNGILEMLLFIIVMIVSIVAESDKTQVSIWFLILTNITGFIISAILWVFVMHHMFMNTKDESGKRAIKTTVSNIPRKISKSSIHEDFDSMIRQKLLTGSSINVGGGKVLHSSLSRGHSEEKNVIEYDNDNDNDKVRDRLKSHESIQIKYDEAGYCFYVIWWWLMEKREIQNPSKYGERVALRRLFLLIGTASYGYLSIKAFIDCLNITVKQMVVNFFDHLGIGMTWPDDDNGGTLFDSTFSVYNEARIISTTCSIVAFILFCCSVFCDFFLMRRKGLKYSRIFGWLSIFALFAGIFAPALPDYLSATPIHDVCPYCAPQFTHSIYLIFGDLVGLGCSGFFTITMLPILVAAVVPAIARSNYMVLHYYELYKLDLNEQDTIRYIFICGSFLGPFTTFAPLLVYQQIMGDFVISILLIVFWILPILIATQVTTKNVTKVYLSYMGVYYGTLFAIFVYHWIVYGLPHWVIVMIQTPHWIIETILEVAAEVCLTNVLLSDFLYTIIMGFRTKHINKDYINK
eukprot:36262_1